MAKLLILLGLTTCLMAGSTAAAADAADKKFPDDFYASKEASAAASAVLPDSEKVLLAGFLLRVRWCDMEQKKWIHRGLTYRQAVALEKSLQRLDGPLDAKEPKLACSVK